MENNIQEQKPKLKIDNIVQSKRKVNINKLLQQSKLCVKFAQKKTRLVDKYDRIEAIKIKFELLKAQKEIEYLKMLSLIEDEQEILKNRQSYKQFVNKLDEDFLFLEKINTSDTIEEAEKEQIKNIAQYQIKLSKNKQDILTADEIDMLIDKKTTILERI